MAEPFAVDWLYVPSTELGGDSLGYHWVDPDHFALYLLDVCGHGVGAALLSVAVINTLRSGALAGTDFRSPEQVLWALNRAYQMENQNEQYFTIWYGVYQPGTGRLRYASAGHPPPILLTGTNGDGPLRARGPALGVLPAARYLSEECTLVPPARLFLFSDGAYEITRPDGSMSDFASFEDALAGGGWKNGGSDLGELLSFAREVRGAPTLKDDFSILRMSV